FHGREKQGMTFWGFKKIPGMILLLWIFGVAVPAFSQVSVCFDGECFYPELAETSEQKQKGLMGREKLEEREGMLFVYDRDIRPAFWMKGMKIPLDFLWLDDGGKVVDLHQDIQPCGEECPSIVSRYPLQYVLEIPAGTVSRTGIEIGDTAVINWGA